MFACAISTDEFKCFQNVLQANTHSMFVTRPVGLCQCLFPANSLTPVQRCKATNGATRARNVRRYGYSASRAPCHTVLLAAAPAVFQPRGGPSNPKRWHHKKSGAEHSIQRHSSSPTGLSGGYAKPIFDHAHERSAKRQGEPGLILCPLSSNLPYRSRRVELRLQQRRKTGEAGFELSVPRDTTKVLKTPEVASA